jgi:hypothetical protein
MRKFLVAIGLSLLAQPALIAQTQQHPDKCGMQHMHEAMIAKDPSWAQKFADQRASLQAAADNYLHYKKAQGPDERTTTISAVPVIFHIIVDSAQVLSLGGTAGIIQRCDSQIAVLNADFNRQNSDSSSIPSAWKPLYGNVGIHFGLARKDPSGNNSPGYEIKIISGTTLTDAGFSDDADAFPQAKTASTGLASWDVTKYYNVWCINFTGSTASGLLGLTVPLSETGTGFSSYPVDQEGVCMLYNVLGSTGPTGVTPTGTGTWEHPYNLGRTLTHETGHMFEIWHPWGDDGGQCPTWSSSATVDGITCVPGVGYDDGLADTPPESDAIYGNPTYTITGGTFNDCCMMHGATNTQPIGVACLSYMDYTDDDAMHLFTTEQAAAMASMVLMTPATGVGGATGSGYQGENYSLTQNPSLLIAATEGVAPSPIEVNSSLSIYPNPSTGQVFVSVNAATETLSQIIVINLLGQEVMTIPGQGKDYYSIDLSGVSKGIYFVKCNFASGSVTRKILLQ